MLIFQTTIDHRAMTALARVNRKTLRRGSSFPVRTLAWFVAALELFLTATYLRGGHSGWQVNALLGLFMLGCLLTEDRVNGLFALRRIPQNARAVNTVFQEESCYVCRTQAGENWWPYSSIRAAAETEQYFILMMDRTHGQVYSKEGLSVGTPEEFRKLIHRKTGLKIQNIR